MLNLSIEFCFFVREHRDFEFFFFLKLFLCDSAFLFLGNLLNLVFFLLRFLLHNFLLFFFNRPFLDFSLVPLYLFQSLGNKVSLVVRGERRQMRRQFLSWLILSYRKKRAEINAIANPLRLDDFHILKRNHNIANVSVSHNMSEASLLENF